MRMSRILGFTSSDGAEQRLAEAMRKASEQTERTQEAAEKVIRDPMTRALDALDKREGRHR
jgi:F0F1-type ATP synthase membrane subunit b/b'